MRQLGRRNAEARTICVHSHSFSTEVERSIPCGLPPMGSLRMCVVGVEPVGRCQRLLVPQQRRLFLRPCQRNPKTSSDWSSPRPNAGFKEPVRIFATPPVVNRSPVIFRTFTGGWSFRQQLQRARRNRARSPAANQTRRWRRYGNGAESFRGWRGCPAAGCRKILPRPCDKAASADAAAATAKWAAPPGEASHAAAYGNSARRGRTSPFADRVRRSSIPTRLRIFARAHNSPFGSRLSAAPRARRTTSSRSSAAKSLKMRVSDAVAESSSSLGDLLCGKPNALAVCAWVSAGCFAEALQRRAQLLRCLDGYRYHFSYR